jgi:hypothetical protein
MGFMILAVALLVSLVLLLQRQHREERRLALEKDLPMERRLPRHYRSFAEVEKRLWLATEAYEQTSTWESKRLNLRSPQLRLLREYLRGLRQDLDRGNRIFGAVIAHSPNTGVLMRLEWQRLQTELSFHLWYSIVSVRLATRAVSVMELRRLTNIVASLAYEVRAMLANFERSGNTDFVEWILKTS